MHNIYYHGNRKRKEIALTFDDGPFPQATEPILEILKQHKVRATFFVNGESAARFPNLVKKIRFENHEIGNHGYTHKTLLLRSCNVIHREIDKTDEILKEITGFKTNLFRPPYMRWGIFLYNILLQKNKKIVLADVSPKDFSKTDPDEVVTFCQKKIKNGSIIVLHDNKKTVSITPKALDKLIYSLKEMEYEIRTVSDVLHY